MTCRVPPAKIRVVERGRDAERFRPAGPGERAAGRTSIGVAHDAELIVGIGRHEYDKGFDVLFDAVAALQSRRDRMVLAVAGREGSQTPDLERRIADLPRPADVHLLGDRDDVAEILRCADLFVLSSRREGAAGAAIEAMATGLPIVASELAGTVGVLHDGREAVLVPPGEPDLLAAGLARVLDDSVLAHSMGQSARDAFVDRFTLDQATAAMAELYRSTAAAPPASLRSIIGRRA